MAKHAGRSTRRFKKLRALFREQCERQLRPCWLCGQPIDYSLLYPHDDSWSLDHRWPLATHRHLAEDPGNFEASHLDCNRRRNKRGAPASLGERSREW